MLFDIARQIKAVMIRSLSAMGSRIVPSSVFWLNLRATNPSRASLMTATKNISNGRYEEKLPSFL
jgi:hypothetical protein